MPITVLQKQSSVYNYFRSTGFIFLLTVGCGYAAQGQSPAQQEQTPASGQPQPQVDAVSPSPSQAAVEQPQSGVEAKESKDQPTAFWNATVADWIQVGINATLLVIILFQTGIYHHQRQIMQKQIDDVKITQRAYIGVKEVVLNGLSLGCEPCFTVIFLNGGQTPAWKVKVPARVGLADTFPDERPDVSREGSTFMPAGDEREVNYPIPVKMNTTWLAAIKGGTKKVYMYGEVHFQDSWGEEQIHSFKLVYNPLIDRVQDYKGDNAGPEIKIIP